MRPVKLKVVLVLAWTFNVSRGMPTESTSRALPEIIDPKDETCLPRITCPKASFRSDLFDVNQPFTDNLNAMFATNSDFSFGNVDLPPNALDVVDSEDSDTLAVVAEVDEDLNPFISQSKRACTKDQLDYCAGSAYKSATHTMCRFCGLGPKCPYYIDPTKNDMTGRTIQDQTTIDYILQLHNEIRSKIAQGRCQQPKAGCMKTLQWDPELARVAQKWADQCAQVDYKGDITRKDPILVHDKHGDRKIERFSNWQGAGQSIARDISKGRAGTFDAHKLVGHWFNQILYFDPEAVKSFGSGNQCSPGIGYYTQLVWQDTTHVGCGWTQFQYRGFNDYFENFLVCNYGPSANIWQQPIYDIANETCNCPCIGCNPKTGLCPPNCKFGVWSSWEPWSFCSASCGGGNRKRKRDCAESNFPPKTSPETQRLISSFGSLDLVPVSSNETFTNNRAGRAGRFSSRSLGFDDTTLFRFTRQASTLDPTVCKRGDLNQTSSCNTHPCPKWSNWGAWSSCTKTCGGGEEKRERICQAPDVRNSERAGESVCPGLGSETRPCNTNACPELSQWTIWSSCSQSCGTGSRTRTRQCILKDCPKCAASRDEKNPCNANLFERELCNQQACPSLTEWSPWSSCSSTCGGGIQSRNRGCIKSNSLDSEEYTDEYEDETPCDGDLKEERACNAQECPSWTTWTSWSECSLTCGGGQRTRGRICAPAPGATYTVSKYFCPGNEKETEQCNKEKCPGLGPWSDWSQCSLSCGGGEKSRTRECGYNFDPKVTGSVQSNPCKVPLTETTKCNQDKCPVYGSWGEWSQCSVTCGGGSKKRQRECVSQVPGLEPSKVICDGPSQEEKICNTNVCPSWTTWSSWGECSVTCGGGKRLRSRKCTLPDGSTSDILICPGKDTDVEKCNEKKCPVLGPWSDWTPCSVSCGGGMRERNRECGLPKSVDENPCKEPLKEKEICGVKKCPIFTDWSGWTPCSASCGGGFKQKHRDCVDADFYTVSSISPNPCKGPLEVVEECNKQGCPYWTPWGMWTECSRTCGGGQQRRFRQCFDPDSGQTNSKLCIGDAEEAVSCNNDQCPYWTEWSDWTVCTKTCGGGLRSKVRECLVPKSGDDKLPCEGETRITEQCNSNECPVWNEWTEWTECSLTCGGGTQQRIRECTLPKLSDFQCDGEGRELRSCNKNDCPVWTEWTDWSACTVSCGGGIKVKTRECTLPQVLGIERLKLLCPGESSETASCSEEACPKPTQWSEWSPCSKSCGGGTRTKVRECINQRDSNGNPCKVDLVESEVCNADPCPEWTEWTPWTECTQSCGGGSRKKARECLLPKSSEKEIVCDGEHEVIEDCNTKECPVLTPWSEWTSCSVTCGGGSKRRVRDCMLPKTGSGTNPCLEPLEEVSPCGEINCPQWTEWTEWTECSQPCGGGTRTKIRECYLKDENQNLDENSCDGGSRNETESCNTQSCPEWTNWTEWSQCSSTCGGGSRHRARECSTPVFKDGKLTCEGNNFEDEVCNVENCPQWSSWGEWSSCSSTCGQGTRSRSRSCNEENDLLCGEGVKDETDSCNLGDCIKESEWTEWSDWSSCSKSCGGGSTTRNRVCRIPTRRNEIENQKELCPGPSTVMLFCNLEDCPSLFQWTDWGSWSECSQKCGGGSRSRSRTCQKVESEFLRDLEGSDPNCPGLESQLEPCNSNACFGWSVWGPWSACTVSCGDGHQSRERNCGNPEEDENEIDDRSGVNMNFGAILDACDGDFQQSQNCKVQECPLLISPECSKLMPSTIFGSFSGDPAQSIADCTWDFFGCTNRANKKCCQERFDNCCMKVMEKKKKKMPIAITSTTPSTVVPITQGPKDKVQLIDCIWAYYRCANKNEKTDLMCKEDFNMCSMLAMGMPLNVTSTTISPTTTTSTTRSPISDIDLPELPDFLKPETSSTGRPLTPIQDIDLPEGAGIIMEEDKDDGAMMQCMVRLHKCQDQGIRNCQNVEHCLSQEAVVAEPDEDSESFNPIHDISKPTHVDNKICSEANTSSDSYLVPHPEDCTKFYSCQRVGFEMQWIAHLTKCPESTGFDESLKVCNYIQALPRCKKVNV